MGSVDSPLAIISSTANVKSVAEHVQQACTSGYTGIARVTVVGDVGYWYFRRGAVVHALTLDQMGEEAALQMLSWEGGNWEACSRPWPSEPSIFLTWVELFQRAGERQQAAPPHAVALPPSVSPSATPVRSHRPAPPSSLAPPRPLPSRSEPPPMAAAQLEALAEHASAFVVVERDGRSRTVRGTSGTSDNLAELTSYVLQLCEGIGSQFGSGRCQALEIDYPAHTLFVVCRGTSTFALTIPRTAELDLVKAKLRI